MNRGNCRMDIFRKPGDFAAFVTILEEGRKRVKIGILAYCLMSNHLVLWPRKAGNLSTFVQWISSTHVRRWREHRANVGNLYQGRFKASRCSPTRACWVCLGTCKPIRCGPGWCSACRGLAMVEPWRRRRRGRTAPATGLWQFARPRRAVDRDRRLRFCLCDFAPLRE